MEQKPLLLGEMLLSAGVISEEQLSEGLARQEAEGGRLGVVLVRLGYIDNRTLTKFLTEQTQRNINRIKGD